MPPYTTTASTTSKPVILPGAKTLQDQLHDLISRFTLASEHIKNWNESGSSNDATAVSNAHTHNTTIHAESTSRLLLLIQEGLKSLQKVEATLKTDTELRLVLMNIHVPYDLLELLDYTNINPDLYLRGLVNEATQQLVGLQRRKSALHLLSTTIEQRLNDDDDAKQQVSGAPNHETVTNIHKRDLESSLGSDKNQLRQATASSLSSRIDTSIHDDDIDDIDHVSKKQKL